jgi:D-lactate dehydrogenase (cytochrome)
MSPARIIRAKSPTSWRFVTRKASGYSQAVAISIHALDRLEAELVEALGADQVSRSDAVREQHGRDESWRPPSPPDLVVYPRSTEEVVAVVERCRDAGAPIVPFGAGTSLEGHVAALEGGVCVDLTRMNRILRIDVEDMDATVEAGVTRKQLEARLRPEGVFFPVDPGADATIGGMIGTGASGTTAVRYGTMRENVLSLTVVTARGKVVRTRSRARKSSAGYDLTRLFVGSEGTLGIVTDATLRIYPTPEAIASAVCPFATLDGAVTCVIRTVQLGVPVARIELLDELQLDAVNRRFGFDYPVAPTLFLEFHGSERSVEEDAEAVKEIAAELGAGEFLWASAEEDRRRLWEARHASYEACLALRPGCRGFATDVCVPISRLAECILETRRDVDEAGLLAPIIGHAGDGNFHVLFLVDPDDPQEIARVEEVNGRMIRRAIELGGTCTGEHGVGYGKAPYLLLEHGEEGLELMRAVKAALDPDGIMNPGKILPPRL